MRIKARKSKYHAQTATEYIVLLGAVTAIVLGGWNAYFNTTMDRSEEFFNVAARGIMGPGHANLTNFKKYP